MSFAPLSLSSPSSSVVPILRHHDLLASGDSDDDVPHYEQVEEEESFYEIVEEEEGEGDDEGEEDAEEKVERNDGEIVSSIDAASSSSLENAIIPPSGLLEREISLPGTDNSSFAIGALPNIDYSLPPKVMYFAVKNSGKLSMLNAAYIILREKRVAMSARELWEITNSRNWTQSVVDRKSSPAYALYNSIKAALAKPNCPLVQFQNKTFGLSELLPYEAPVTATGEFIKGAPITSSAPPLPPLRPIFVWNNSSPQLIEAAIKLQPGFCLKKQGRHSGSGKLSDFGPTRKEKKLAKMLAETNMAEWSIPIAESTRKRKAASFSSASDENTFRLAVNYADVSVSSSTYNSQDFGSNLVEALLDSAERELKSKNWNDALQGFQAKRRALSSLGESELCIPQTQKDGKVIRYEFYVKKCEF